MKPATQEQIEEACMTRSAEEARAYLAGLGYHAKVTHCRDTVVRLVSAGARVPLKTGAVDTEIKAEHAVMGSDRLARAMIASFRRKAKRLGCTVEDAMATSLYDPATVSAWKRVA